MKLIQVIPHFDQEATGPTQSVVRLSETLVLQGHEVEIHTMAAGRALRGVKVVSHQELRALGRFGFSLEMARALKTAAGTADILHNHSLWAFPNMAAGLVTRPQSCALITSPRGTLAPAALARSRVRKAVFKKIQWPAVTQCSVLHATSSMEYEDIRSLGLRTPVAVIPNGIDVPDQRHLSSSAL